MDNEKKWKMTNNSEGAVREKGKADRKENGRQEGNQRLTGRATEKHTTVTVAEQKSAAGHTPG